jgi:regulator of replication initiation timing
MTNSEAIKLLSQEKIPMTLDGKLNEPLVIAHIKAISVFEENTKLKADVERLKEEIEQWQSTNLELVCELTRIECENNQLKSELEQSVKLPLTNADKIRSMSDEELAEFLSENTNCDCCNIQCVDKLNCPSMSSCLFRFIEWLKSEVPE